MTELQLTKPKCTLADLVLPDSVKTTIAAMVEDLEYIEALAAAGVKPRRKLLLWGPTGCGKTSVAHGVATVLGLRLYEVSLAQTIGAYVGETGKQVEKIFQFAAMNKVLVLIDEFDSVGANRITAATVEAIEGNRSVNTLLTAMDRYEPAGLVMACTNRRDSLDSAVLRRFDMDLEIPPASKLTLRLIAESIIRGRYGLDANDALARANTPATVAREATEMLRRKVVEAAKLQRSETLPLFERGRIFGPREFVK